MKGLFLPLAALAALAMAKDVVYDLNLTWVTANPDGMQDRSVVGANNEWPLPILKGDKGDQMYLNIDNHLDTTCTLHVHGMFHNGSNYMDGDNMVVQCPMVPGTHMTLNFTLQQSGTYWYHCHTDYCYPNGFRQAMVIYDEDDPYQDEYEEEFIVTLSDWYHTPSQDLEPEFMSLYNPTGAEPIPDSFLFNDGVEQKLAVKPNTTYMMRIINVAGFTALYFYIEGHTMTIVEADGVFTEKQETDLLYIGTGQRYTVLVTTKDTTDQNYAMVTIVDWDMLDTIPSTLQMNTTNWLMYNSEAAFPQGVVTVNESSELRPFDDIALVPYDHQPLLPEPDLTVNTTIWMKNLMTGENYALFDDITYTAPKVPSLYTAISAGDDLVGNTEIYGEFVHPVVLGHQKSIQVIINNADTGTHPIHLHGHNFQIVARDPPYGEHYRDYADYVDAVPFDANNHTAFPAYPMRRDVVNVPPMGSTVIRFYSDNPGVWFFHCQVDWHLASGLALVFIEAPDKIVESHGNVIPPDHLAVCEAAGVPVRGNAAGNSDNYLDLAGENKAPKFIPQGWTPRGEAAMAFSVLSAVLGIAAIVVYGMDDLKNLKKSVSNEQSVETEGK